MVSKSKCGSVVKRTYSRAEPVALCPRAFGVIPASTRLKVVDANEVMANDFANHPCNRN